MFVENPGLEDVAILIEEGFADSDIMEPVSLIQVPCQRHEGHLHDILICRGKRKSISGRPEVQVSLDIDVVRTEGEELVAQMRHQVEDMIEHTRIQDSAPWN